MVLDLAPLPQGFVDSSGEVERHLAAPEQFVGRIGDQPMQGKRISPITRETFEFVVPSPPHLGNDFMNLLADRSK